MFSINAQLCETDREAHLGQSWKVLSSQRVRDHTYLVEGTVSLRCQLNRHRLERLVLLPELPNLLSQHRFDSAHPLSHAIDCALQFMHLRTSQTASTLSPETALSFSEKPRTATSAGKVGHTKLSKLIAEFVLGKVTHKTVQLRGRNKVPKRIHYQWQSWCDFLSVSSGPSSF